MNLQSLNAFDPDTPLNYELVAIINYRILLPEPNFIDHCK